MSHTEEFEQLKKRFLQSEEYEKEVYPLDTPEGKAWAEKEFKKIVDRMGELWNQLSPEEQLKHMDLFQ